MKPLIFSLFVLTSTLLSTSHAQSSAIPQFNPIRLISDHLQGKGQGLSGARLQDDIYLVWEYTSWRFVVETNSHRNWKTIPTACVDYVKQYFTPQASLFNVSQYTWDLAQLVTSIAYYLDQEHPHKTDKDTIIFDVSETLLSNLPYYERPDVLYGSKPFNSTSFLEWVKQGKAPAVPVMATLFDILRPLGYKLVLLSGSSESLRGVLEANLKKAGFDGWSKFFLKNEAIPTKEFKSKVRTQLVKEGYKIVANVGDQWRDLTGAHAGEHTFKVPNPMYYLA